MITRMLRTASQTLLAALAALTALAAALGAPAPAHARPPFRVALREVWSEPAARQFTIFIFVSMLAYSAQDLILEPFAGTVFGFTPGGSTRLSGVQHGGVLAGMILVALVGHRFAGKALGSLRGPRVDVGSTRA